MDTARHESGFTPTALAFIGDAAYGLYVRRRLVDSTDCVCGTLHLTASKYVNAKAQAFAYDALEADGVFTEEEADVARRAKNAHLHSHTKAASIADYHRATALEAVVGYLEMTGDAARRDFLLERCFAVIEQNLQLPALSGARKNSCRYNPKSI